MYAGDRLIGQITTREPEFSPDDLALLLAHQLIEDDRGPHGHLMSEATDPLADPARGDGWRYEANGAPRIDYAAQAIAKAKKDFYDQPRNKEIPRDGHIWLARRVDS